MRHVEKAIDEFSAVKVHLLCSMMVAYDARCGCRLICESLRAAGMSKVDLAILHFID